VTQRARSGWARRVGETIVEWQAGVFRSGKKSPDDGDSLELWAPHRVVAVMYPSQPVVRNLSDCCQCGDRRWKQQVSEEG
jgi:hypothetical protein